MLIIKPAGFRTQVTRSSPTLPRSASAERSAA
jgi:hypothetical protein